MIRQLCEKVSETVQTFIITIQEFSNSNIPQQEPANLDDSVDKSVKRKYISGKNLFYWSSKSAKVKTVKISFPDDFNQRKDRYKMYIDSSA